MKRQRAGIPGPEAKERGCITCFGRLIKGTAGNSTRLQDQVIDVCKRGSSSHRQGSNSMGASSAGAWRDPSNRRTILKGGKSRVLLFAGNYLSIVVAAGPIIESGSLFCGRG